MSGNLQDQHKGGVMHTMSFRYLIMLGALVGQAAHAVHELPNVPQSCLYKLATPHRPDPRPPESTATPEQRCQWADMFSLGNVPTTPVGVITPAGDPRYYCTLDGATLAIPTTVDEVDQALARRLPGPTPCAGDAVCVELFGEHATCAAFGPDASGRSETGWTSLGPASSFAVASDLAGELGAHSVYVRSPGGQGNIFYFSDYQSSGNGVFRTHSLRGSGLLSAGDLPILDITFCKALSSPVVQKARVEGCTGFCRPEPCCGPHFPCEGTPNLPPLTQEPEDRLASLDSQLDALANSGALNQGQANGMRQRIANLLRSMEQGNLSQACNHMSQLILSIEHNINNGSLNPADAGPLQAESIAIRAELGCS
ncbi:MAG: hypothetical protein H7A19_19610 [Rhodanobacteraceae bacterium]|nr:hypothetical protein [Rhodanobacteraceae bacterium]